MCFFSAPAPAQDNSAQIAAEREAKRQQDIAAGRARIDEAFGQFNDPYYQGVEKSYTDYYNPQVDSQYEDAQRKLKLNLARTGNLNSGSGARQLGDLTRAYTDQRTAISGQAIDQANKQRGTVEQTKGELYNQNTSAADPAAAAASAAARVGTLSSPQSFSPLSALFASFFDNAATNVAAESRGYPGYGTGLFALPKTGTAKVVN